MAVVHLSPEMPRISVRGHKREPSEPIDFLSASYRTPAEGEEEAPGELQRSYSGRPRSRSTSQALGANNGKQRKSLRSLGRSVSKTTKAKQGEGRSSASDADHGTTQQIESAFTKIREQLAKLSEEDQVLRERVDKLNDEINILNSCSVSRRQHANTDLPNGTTTYRKSLYSSASISEGDYPSKLTKSPRSVPVLVISSSGSFENGPLHSSGIIHQSIDEQTVCDVQCAKLSEEDGGTQVTTTLKSFTQQTGQGSDKTVMQLHKS